MADSMFHQPVMGRRAFVGGTLAASSMAFLAACGQKGGDPSGSESGSTLNFYINNPVCIDPYNVQEDQGTQVEYQLFDALTSYDAEKGEIVPLACESFEANDDATEFTFKIKKATFHNGDDEERVAKMQEADAMVAADCPVIPVMFYTHTIVGSDRIKHLYVDPQKHAELGTAELA